MPGPSLGARDTEMSKKRPPLEWGGGKTNQCVQSVVKCQMESARGPLCFKGPGGGQEVSQCCLDQPFELSGVLANVRGLHGVSPWWVGSNCMTLPYTEHLEGGG